MADFRADSRTGKHSRTDGNSNLFYKTRLCPNFEAGSCFRGADCTYAHGVAELRESVILPPSEFKRDYKRLVRDKGDGGRKSAPAPAPNAVDPAWAASAPEEGEWQGDRPWKVPVIRHRLGPALPSSNVTERERDAPRPTDRRDDNSRTFDSRNNVDSRNVDGRNVDGRNSDSRDLHSRVVDGPDYGSRHADGREYDGRNSGGRDMRREARDPPLEGGAWPARSMTSRGGGGVKGSMGSRGSDASNGARSHKRNDARNGPYFGLTGDKRGVTNYRGRGPALDDTGCLPGAGRREPPPHGPSREGDDRQGGPRVPGGPGAGMAPRVHLPAGPAPHGILSRLSYRRGQAGDALDMAPGGHPGGPDQDRDTPLGVAREESRRPADESRGMAAGGLDPGPTRLGRAGREDDATWPERVRRGDVYRDDSAVRDGGVPPPSRAYSPPPPQQQQRRGRSASPPGVGGSMRNHDQPPLDTRGREGPPFEPRAIAPGWEDRGRGGEVRQAWQGDRFPEDAGGARGLVSHQPPPPLGLDRQAGDARGGKGGDRSGAWQVSMPDDGRFEVGRGGRGERPPDSMDRSMGRSHSRSRDYGGKEELRGRDYLAGTEPVRAREYSGNEPVKGLGYPVGKEPARSRDYRNDPGARSDAGDPQDGGQRGAPDDGGERGRGSGRFGIPGAARELERGPRVGGRGVRPGMRDGPDAGGAYGRGRGRGGPGGGLRGDRGNAWREGYMRGVGREGGGRPGSRRDFQNSDRNMANDDDNNGNAYNNNKRRDGSGRDSVPGGVVPPGGKQGGSAGGKNESDPPGGGSDSAGRGSEGSASTSRSRSPSPSSSSSRSRSKSSSSRRSRSSASATSRSRSRSSSRSKSTRSSSRSSSRSRRSSSSSSSSSRSRRSSSSSTTSSKSKSRSRSSRSRSASQGPGKGSGTADPLSLGQRHERDLAGGALSRGGQDMGGRHSGGRIDGRGQPLRHPRGEGDRSRPRADRAGGQATGPGIPRGGPRDLGVGPARGGRGQYPPREPGEGGVRDAGRGRDWQGGGFPPEDGGRHPRGRDRRRPPFTTGPGTTGPPGREVGPPGYHRGGRDGSDVGRGGPRGVEVGGPRGLGDQPGRESLFARSGPAGGLRGGPNGGVRDGRPWRGGEGREPVSRHLGHVRDGRVSKDMDRRWGGREGVHHGVGQYAPGGERRSKQGRYVSSKLETAAILLTGSGNEAGQDVAGGWEDRHGGGGGGGGGDGGGGSSRQDKDQGGSHEDGGEREGGYGGQRREVQGGDGYGERRQGPRGGDGDSGHDGRGGDWVEPHQREGSGEGHAGERMERGGAADGSPEDPRGGLQKVGEKPGWGEGGRFSSSGKNAGPPAWAIMAEAVGSGDRFSPRADLTGEGSREASGTAWVGGTASDGAASGPGGARRLVPVAAVASHDDGWVDNGPPGTWGGASRGELACAGGDVGGERLGTGGKGGDGSLRCDNAPPSGSGDPFARPRSAAADLDEHGGRNSRDEPSGFLAGGSLGGLGSNGVGGDINVSDGTDASTQGAPPGKAKVQASLRTPGGKPWWEQEEEEEEGEEAIPHGRGFNGPANGQHRLGKRSLEVAQRNVAGRLEDEGEGGRDGARAKVRRADAGGSPRRPPHNVDVVETMDGEEVLDYGSGSDVSGGGAAM